MGPGPYRVFGESPSASELGSAARAALEAASFEDLAGEAIAQVAEQRTLELARAAGVGSWSTFERGTRLVGVDRDADEILVEPNHRKRGYWEPTPDRYWQRLRRPSDVELGDAIFAALERSTA